jgi:hypothetical protein
VPVAGRGAFFLPFQHRVDELFISCFHSLRLPASLIGLPLQKVCNNSRPSGLTFFKAQAIMPESVPG